MKGSVLWVRLDVCHRALTLAIVLLVTVAASQRSWAAPSDSAATARQPLDHRVELHVMGSERALELIRETSQELFDRLDVQVDVIAAGAPAPPAGNPPLAIAHVNLTPPHASIVILDGATGEPIDRRSVLDATTVEAAVEATTHIAYFVVETLLMRAPAGPARPEPEPAPSSAEEPVALPPPPKPEQASILKPPPGGKGVGAEAGVGLGVTSLGDSRVLPGLGILAELRSARPGGPFAALSATTYASSELSLEGASATLRLSALRLLGGFDVSTERSLALSLALGAGLDWLKLSKGSTTAEVAVSRSRSLIYPLLSGAAGIRLRVSGRMLVSALGGADLSLADHRFEAAVDGERRVLLTMPTLRPFVLVAASASFDETSRFEARAEPP